MWTACKRILKAGFVGFWRNAFVSFTSVLVMTVALFMVATTIFNNHALEVALGELEHKVDINIYFLTTAPEEQILALKGLLEQQPEVAEVAYTSRSQALEEFRTRHEGDDLTIQALEELGDNPLGASLSVRAKETSQYEGIAAFLTAQEDNPAGGGERIIDRINYYQNKAAISRLGGIVRDTRGDNLIKAILLIAIALIVAFNTIRLAIHNSREEIGVMRLVGASNPYISMPFMVSGILQGLIAGILVVLLLYPALIFYESAFYPFPFFAEAGYDKLLFGYFVNNFPKIFGILVGSGVLIGAVSSFFAVRRYLRV
jgi:cell division transport system permease protein